jgi:transcriptional regulator with XRE-family HTH domain
MGRKELEVDPRVAPLGTVLREQRNRRGVERRELAEASDITENFLHQVEKGRRAPSARVLNKLANALGCDVSEMMALRDQQARIASASVKTSPDEQVGRVVFSRELASLNERLARIESILEQLHGAPRFESSLSQSERDETTVPADALRPDQI